MIPGRVVIYVRDVINITGRSESGARALLQKIRKALGKKPDQCITINEFCEYSGIAEKIVREFMKN
ncbi:hypothetical protein [Chitinophaga barathri]|uniref:Uncharacterized protein n=1 Tax=Chitinophaga barathri TaxID=1647451 RepID=A0A3N4MW01_9BACT|nr:hypothetical protein [Chitinophaga barathri]RPD39573.1 hypothetical protein EG028_18120 [Chitinophaga barathri]